MAIERETRDPIGSVEVPLEDDARAQAYALVQAAIATPSDDEAATLALRALDLDPDNAPAVLVLARTANTVEDALSIAERATAAALRSLPDDCLENEQWVGNFWYIVETRPYLDARFAEATCLSALGQRQAASAIAAELLRLNPDDCLGVRYNALAWLLLDRHLAAAEELAARFADDSMVAWTYLTAMLDMLQGRLAAAEVHLRTALRANPNVMYVLSLEDPPPLPGEYEPGSMEEAIVAADIVGAVLAEDEVLMAWLSDTVMKLASAQSG